MDDRQKLELSMHYDTLQWTVTTIITAAVGGLLLYAFSAKDFSPAVAALGGFFTLVSIFFAASFRALRQRIHEHLPSSYTAFVRSSPMLRQWPVFLLLHAVLFLAFVWLLIDRRPEWTPLWAGFAVFGLLVIIVYGLTSGRRSLARKPKVKDA